MFDELLISGDWPPYNTKSINVIVQTLTLARGLISMYLHEAFL